jgi:hypothetical protein
MSIPGGRSLIGVAQSPNNPLIEDGMGVKKFVTWIMSNRMLAARSKVSLPTATTLSFTVIGTAYPISPAERRWWNPICDHTPAHGDGGSAPKAALFAAIRILLLWRHKRTTRT